MTIKFHQFIYPRDIASSSVHLRVQTRRTLPNELTEWGVENVARVPTFYCKNSLEVCLRSGQGKWSLLHTESGGLHTYLLFLTLHFNPYAVSSTIKTHINSAFAP